MKDSVVQGEQGAQPVCPSFSDPECHGEERC